MKYVPIPVRRDLRLVGQYLTRQRKLMGLTVQDVALRARVSQTTVSNMEHGKAVRTDSLLSIARVLHMADSLVKSVDPLETDVGRLRADEQLPQRVRK